MRRFQEVAQTELYGEVFRVDAKASGSDIAIGGWVFDRVFRLVALLPEPDR